MLKMVGSKLYLGIDPGRSKTGLALVDAQGGICALKVVFMDDFENALCNFCTNAALEAIIMGDGTNSKAVSKVVVQNFPDVPFYVVGEAYSTEDARKLYWEINPPSGFKKLIPLGLLVPNEPLDAYAAVVQVRRWLNKR